MGAPAGHCRIVAEHIPSTPDERTDLIRSFGIKAYASHPLQGEGNRMFGTLSFGTRTRETFSDDDLAMMQAVADQVAIAMMRMEDEKALRDSEGRYRNLMELSPSAIFVNRNGLIEMLNPAALKLFGAESPAQLLGKTPYDVFHPDYHNAICERIDKLLQGHAVPSNEEKIICIDGAERDVEVAAAPFTDSEGIAIQVVLRDVTERKQADEARIKVEKLLKRELQINAALAELSITLISSNITIREIDEKVLDTAKRLTGSRHGYAAVVDTETKNLVNIAVSSSEGMSCRIAKKERERAFKADSSGHYDGLWGHALNTRKPFYENSPANHPAAKGMPQGHIPVENFLSVPVMMGTELVGQIALADADHEYTDNDLNTVMRVAYLYTLAIQRVNYEIALEDLNRSLERRVEERSRDLLRINEKLLSEIEVRKKAELRLREGEEMARALMNTPTEPVLLITVEGTIIDANEELAKRIGLEKIMLMGSSMYEIVHPDFALLRRRKIGDVLETGKAVRFEEHSGDSWFDTIIYPVRGDGGMISKLAVFSHDITDMRRMQKHIMEISELERQRIGRDIHDSLGQKLTGIGFLAEALKQTMQEKSYPELADIEEIIYNITDSIDHARKISSGLWTERFQSYDAFQALEELAADTRNLFRIDCFLNYDVSLAIGNNTVVTNLYNVAKESINNAIKHGKADRIELEMYEEEEMINLKIADNGKGAAENFESKKGIGLNIIRYRAGIIGGAAQFKTGINGFEVLISVKKEILKNYFN
jgi:PAS domain S-box-containing protein